MAKRYADLTKIPPDPALRFLAASGMKLKTEAEVLASADVERMLYALDDKEAWVDIIKMLAVALPAREAVWWACLAARDLLGPEPGQKAACVKATEAWVFEPTDKQRAVVQRMLEQAEPGDHTSLCASAAVYAAGNMGPGEMSKYPAPLGAVAANVFGINLLAMSEAEDPEGHLQLLIDRGLNIARGGNGRVEPASNGANSNVPGIELAPAKGES